MINSLFETFDPHIRTGRINILVIIVPAMLPFINSKYFLPFRRKKIIEIIKNFLFSELRASLSNNNKKIKTEILYSIFLLILIFNVLGLIPFVYTITRQALFTLSLALPFWLSFIIFSIFYSLQSFLRHLVPLSTPIALSQFMVIIERVRQVIRPITLSVRLCANMTAGHILIALCRKPIFFLGYFSIALLLLLVLEIAVAFIQRYVFTMLTTIYLREAQ